MKTDKSRSEALLERVSSALIVLDRDGHCTYFSRRAERLLGVPAWQVTGRILWKAIPTLDASRLHAEVHHAMEEQSLRSFEELDQESGEWFSWRLSPAPDSVSIYCSEISEQKRREEDLHLCEQSYARLVSALGRVVWVADGEFSRFLYISEPVTKMLGYPVDHWIEQPGFWKEHLHPDDRDRCSAARLNQLATGNDLTIEYRIVAADGHTVWVNEISSPQVHADGHVRVRGVLLEISERKAQDKERQRLLHDLQERVKEFTAVAGTVYLIQRTDREFTGVLNEIVRLLPPAFQYPELTAARITIRDQQVTTSNFREAADRLCVTSNTNGRSGCKIEVVYLEPQPPAKIGPFLAEEQLLLQTIADLVQMAAGQRNALDAVKEQELFFRTLLQSSWDLFAVFDAHGECVYESPAIERITGYSPEELVGTEALQWLHPEDHEAWKTFLKDVTVEATPGARVEVRGRQLDGRWRNLEAIGQRILDDNGKPAAVITARDITERKEIEHRLRESEERFRRIFEECGVGMAVMDLDQRFLEVNPAYCRFLGYSEDELRTMKERDVVYSDDLPAYDRLWDEVMQGRRHTLSMDKRCVRKDGRLVWAHLTGVFPRENGDKPACCIAVVQDISTRKQAEDEVRRTDRFYRSLIENSSDNITVLDEKGTTLFQSPAIFRQLGYRPEELVGRNNVDLVHPDDWGKATRRLLETLQRGETKAPQHLRFRNKDGSWRILETVGKRFVDDSGKVVGIFNSRDVTERVIAGELIQRAKQQAEAANLAKDRFLAALSHELRTPLTPVVALLPALLQIPEIPENVKADLAMIKQSVDLETRLIDDLLDLTRITQGKIHLNKEKIDVHELLRSTEMIVRSDALAKRIDVRMELSAGEHWILADRVRLQQVLWNLLKNAIKFSPLQSQIVVTSSNPEPGRVQLAVRDQGVGIEPDQAARIFDAFVQTISSGGHQFGGLGLGLFISRAMVEQHNGTIEVKSEGLGKGATFVVTLATVPDGATEEAVPSHAGSTLREGPPLRILLVEDHENTREVLARLLSRQGHTVLPAQSIQEALDVAEKNEVDVAISDLGLPDGSGLDLMPKLREKYGLRGIAVSGYGMESDLRESKGAGFDAHLVKPIDFRRLQTALQEVTQKTSSAEDRV